MQGKVCVLTGGTNGFGLLAAERLAAAGARVLLLGRSRARGEAACARVEARTGRRPELVLAELELQREVRGAAREVAARVEGVDVLLNSAGFAFGERQLTAEGFERTFALNYLAYFTLCRELLPLLRGRPGARIVNTASAAHRRVELRLDNLQGERDFGRRRFPPLSNMYAQSNVARIMLTYELAAREPSLVVNCFCPGFVLVERTDATPLQNWLVRSLPRWLLPRSTPPEESADTMVRLAAAPELASVTGAYFEHGVRVRSSPQTYDVALRRALWDRTEALLAALD